MTRTLGLLLTMILGTTLGCGGVEGPPGMIGPQGAIGMTGPAGPEGPAGTVDATYVEAASGTVQDGNFSTDLVYTSADLMIRPGTWLVTAQASVFTTVATDAVAIGIFDATSNADVPQSISASTNSVQGAPVALTTSKVLTVSADTVLRIKAFRNGTSTPHIGTPAPAVYIQSLKPQRISALKLK